MTLFEACGYLGAALAILSSTMRTMIPLRCIAITANVASLVYGVIFGLYPTVISHGILLPMNVMRLVQMLRLIRQVREAASSDLSMDWLKPFMARRSTAAGEVLFAKDETAECMFYTLTGRYRLRETGLEFAQGQVLGEMAFLAPGNRRTQTLECVEAGEVLAISYDELRQLYFQNPAFGFYFLRLTSERLFQNVARLEHELAHSDSAASGRDTVGCAA